MSGNLKKIDGKKTAAIISAQGLGDALIMSTTINFLIKNYNIDLFNNRLVSFNPILKNANCLPYLENPSNYLNYDLVILQNDNSAKAKSLIDLRKTHKLNLIVFYPTYNEKKHGKLIENDTVFDSKMSMIDNVYLACKNIFKSSLEDKFPSLNLPENIQFKKNSKQIAIHPFSGDNKKNWPLKKYLKLAKKLQKKGYSPVVISRNDDTLAIKSDIKTKCFNSLTELAAFLYESSLFVGNDSGPGHLASLLKIPSIIIADNKKRMELWQPGWKKAVVITPSPLIPNIKGLRLREQKWHIFIPVRTLIKNISSLYKKT